MTWALIVVIIVGFAFDVAAWRRQRREHREFMAEMRRKWREKFPVEYERTQVTMSGGPLPEPTEGPPR